jgi:hypothetical protein
MEVGDSHVRYAGLVKFPVRPVRSGEPELCRDSTVSEVDIIYGLQYQRSGSLHVKSTFWRVPT